MDETQTSPKLSEAEPPPSQAEQITPAATTRKRQIDNNDHQEPQPKQARLTRKNLAAFNKMGKKKTSYPSDDSGSTKTKTKTTSTTSSGFADKARNNGILEPAYSQPPTNLKNIHKRHAKSRATASPPESVYNDYVDRVEGAGTEATVVAETSGKLLKEYPKGYKREFNRAFTNCPRNVGFNNDLSAPQPDFVEGLEKGLYRPFLIDEHIPGTACYKDDPRSITLPQIAGEWKGPAGDMREARLQSAYDGAAMVYARSQALAYMGKADPAGHAEITTFTTDGTNLNQYAHYATLSEDGKTLEYHQYPISSINLTGTHQGHKDGRRSLRNAQDHAKAKSEELRDKLKKHWKQQHDNLQTVAGAPLPPPNYGPPIPTYAHDATAQGEGYEEDDGYEIVVDPHCQPTPTDSTKPHKSHPSSKSHSSSHSHHSSEGHKRKAPNSQSSHGSSGHVSKHRSYWKKDPATGRYYHRHSDGTKSWLDDGEDEDGY